MQSLVDKGISLGCETHLHFLNLAAEHKPFSPKVIVDECLVATVQLWMRLDQSINDNIILILHSEN